MIYLVVVMEGGVIHVVTLEVEVEHPEDEVTQGLGHLNHLIILVHILDHIVGHIPQLDVIGMVQGQLVQEMIMVMTTVHNLTVDIADHALTHQHNYVSKYCLLGNTLYTHNLHLYILLYKFAIM